jgi:hypothetical protein
VRRFGWSLAEVGTYYGSAVLVFGTAGAWCGGWFAQSLRRRGAVDADLRASLLGSRPAACAARSLRFSLCWSTSSGGLGPTVVALFTNYVFEDDRALPKSLALTAAVTMPFGITALWSAAHHYRTAVEAVAEIGLPCDEITQKRV